MQVDQQYRQCPVIREAAGEEPYPQVTLAFAGAATGTVQARLFDLSVQPPVELTSAGAIAIGAGLAASGLANIPNSYVLDMGDAGVTAVVDVYSSEGFVGLVKLEDSTGTQSPRYAHVTCNDADHIAQLYPEQAIYAVTNSGNTGTAFPNGSTYLPCQALADACSILTSRNSKILDCAGSWNGGGSGSGGVLQSAVGTSLSAAEALVRTRSTAAWYPHNSGDVIDLVDCKVVSVNVPFGFALGNFSNGTYFAGAPKLVNCRIQTSFFTGNGATRAGSYDGTGNKHDGDISLSAFQSPGCWSFDAVGCINGQAVTVDFSSMGGSTATWVDCGGAYTIANMAAGKNIEMTGISGLPDITLASSTSSGLSSVLLTGAYNQLVNTPGVPSGSITEVPGATRPHLVGNIVNLAAGSVTSTEAPNLDAAITTRATPAQVATELTTYDAATGAEAAAISAAIAAQNDVSTAQVQASAEAAITAQEPVAANITQVNGAAVVIGDFRATGYATPANVTASEGVITTRLDGIEGATFDTATDSLEQIRNNLGGGGGGSSLGPELWFQPETLERPSPSATQTYTLFVDLRNAGVLADADAPLSVSVANQGGTDRSANLGSATMTRVRAGHYTATYDVAHDHPVEQLVFTISGAFSAVAFTFERTAQVLDSSNTQPSLVLSGVP